MENMVNYAQLFGGIYRNRKVLVTGHTGFKGSWLVYWLQKMGAIVYGYALKPVAGNNHISLLSLSINEKTGDIRDQKTLEQYFNDAQPEIVFHMAAQALVRSSYNNPVETYSTNVMGTLHVLEACRKCKSVKAIVNVTSDKCYENKEWEWGYRENDPMGGYDPYSSSKGCAELLAASYRNSYFNLNDYQHKHEVLLACARAGNVIGGGDWAADRLIPDIARATAENKKVFIRNPNATRPWQHVLEPLSGYLHLGWHLLNKEKQFAEGWNFGPALDSNLTVKQVVDVSQQYWDEIGVDYSVNKEDLHEANLLMLDCSRANKLLKWKPVFGIEQTMQKTIGWYKDFYRHQQLNTSSDLDAYISMAIASKIKWAVCS